MIDNDLYVFRKHDKKYPELFKKEETLLRGIIGPESRIEHIGSTSIHGLGGKGIIDIIIIVKKNSMLPAKRKLKKAGFIYKPSASTSERLFFKKENSIPQRSKFVHLHLTYEESLEWKKALAFAEYIRKNRKARADYVTIKKEAVEYAKGNGQKYREYKNEFMAKTTQLALQRFKKSISKKKTL
jgi:GrpB-like predicted nucleotidyltransferase (UPF0157 family)